MWIYIRSCSTLFSAPASHSPGETVVSQLVMVAIIYWKLSFLWLCNHCTTYNVLYVDHTEEPFAWKCFLKRRHSSLLYHITYIGPPCLSSYGCAIAIVYIEKEREREGKGVRWLCTIVLHVFVTTSLVLGPSFLSIILSLLSMLSHFHHHFPLQIAPPA